MAKGRFISKEICIDKRVNELSDGYSLVGFTWLITHADREGRIYGDPAIVKSLIFPRRPEITVSMVQKYIEEWQGVGLIKLYKSNGDIYIEFPNFAKHQVGLRKERESESTIPEYKPENEFSFEKDTEPAQLRQNAGAMTEDSVKNRVNIKLIKVNDNVKVNVGAEKTAQPEPHYEPCDDYGEPIPTKKAKKPKSDGRSKTPAIIAFRRLTGQYPKTINYQDVIDILGNAPNEPLLASCYREWCARGYNAKSIKWLTDWYKNGGVPGRKQSVPEPKGMAAVRAMAQRLEAEDGNG